ncbi:TPA: conjugal transfer protein TraN [Vibrio cholerae]|nr:conjugal transfer protein TraN [Vibrio cholerae]
MKPTFFTRVLAGILSITMACLPLHGVAADVQRQSGLSGQQEGKQLLQNWTMPALNGNTLSVPNGSGNESINLQELFPGMDQGSLDVLTGVYGSDTSMNQLGTQRQESMASESGATGEAFRSLQQIKDRSRPDMVNDPLWALTDAVQTDPNLLTQSFPGCESQGEGSPNYQQCDRLNTAVNSCTITHDYTAGIIEHVSGPMNLRSCGEGCLEVWIGRIGDNYWSGRCKVFEQAITLKVVNPDAITSAVLEYAKWDDYMQVWLGDQKVWSGPNNNFPPETAGRCELSTSWERNPNTDLTARLKAVEPGLEVPVKIRVSVTGSGEGYARIKVRFDPTKVVMNDSWSPQSCIEQAADIPTKFSDYSIQCTDQPSSTNGCTVVNGVSVCESYFAPSPVAGISPLCRRVQVSVDDESYKGIENQACQVLEANPSCGFMSSECAETNDKGECIRFTDTYDCGLQTSDPKCVVSNLMPSSFEACEPTQTITPFTETKHVPDYQVCEKISKLTQCQLERRVSAETHQQSWSIERGCFSSETLSFVPQHSNTMQTGNATLRVFDNQNTEIKITESPSKANGWKTTLSLTGNKETVTETKPSIKYPEMTCPKGTLVGSLCKVVNGSIISWHEPQEVTRSRCETGWNKVDFDTCSREVQKCLAPAKLSASLTFSGKYLEQDIVHQSSDPGIDQCLMQTDQFTAVQWQCLDTGTKRIDGVTVGSGELANLGSLYPAVVSSPAHLTSRGSSDGLGLSCWRAKATYNASTAHPEFNMGSSDSWVDANGNPQTIVNNGQNTTTNTCSALEQNPACQYVRTECTEGGAGHEGFCYIQSLVYDCGQSVEVQNARMETQYNCEGPVRCMGTDCLEPESIKQANFAEAAAMLNAAQFMTNDMSCTGADGQDNVECTVFKGNAGQCKKAVGGIVDCCEKPSGVSLSDYITMIVAVNKLDTAVMAMNPSSAIYGSWNTLREPITSTWSAVKEPFVSAWDSLMGAGPSTAAGAGAEQAATGFMQVLTNKTAEWVGTTFGSGAQSALFSNVGGAVGADGVVSGGNFALGGAAGAVLSTVMTAYMIYSVTMILIQLIWKCEQSEFEMNAKRVLKSCHYIGSYCKSKFLGACVEKRQSYCCFTSPLSRIIQEQVRPQLGLGWGSAKTPNCEGLTASQLNQVDWSQVNLDEWIGILSITGNLPEVPSLDLERLTGSGSTLNVDGNRQSAADRAIERLNGMDAQKLRQEATEEISGNN